MQSMNGTLVRSFSISGNNVLSGWLFIVGFIYNVKGAEVTISMEVIAGFNLKVYRQSRYSNDLCWR